MLTYKVLLVDDEEEVMNVIEHKIDWERLGFEVIGKAQNGVKALEVAEKAQPDVVITDINMQKRLSILRWKNMFKNR